MYCYFTYSLLCVRAVPALCCSLLCTVPLRPGKTLCFMNILMFLYSKHLRAYIKKFVSPELTPVMCVLLMNT